MPLPAHYISSVLISFSTYLERTRVPESEKTEARRLLQALLDQKADIECWETKDVESFVSNHSVFSPVAIATVTRFIEKFPPFQVCVYLNEFLLALAEEGCSNSTIRNYRSDINQFWLFAKTTDLSKLLKKTVMAQFVANEQAKGLQSSSIRRKIAAISQFGLWAHRRHLIQSDVNWMNNPQLLEELQKPEALSDLKSETPASKTALNTVKAPTVPLVPPTIAAPVAHVPQNPLPIQVRTTPTARTTQEHRAQLKEQLDELSLRLRRQSQRMVAPWLTLAAIGLFFLGLGIFGYQQLILNAPRPLAYPNAPVTPNRVLSFQGRLTDTAQNPLTTATDMNFKLYDDETVGSVLWDSGVCSVTPDQDGIFNTALGSTCGAAIPASVFSENSNVWLEVTVESETLTPRQPIWTVPYALNSETLQGYPISASGAATANTVVTMDGSGDIVLGEVGPEIRSTSGQFVITGQSLLLRTQNNGNIILDADGTGSTFINDYLAAPGATFSATYAGGVPLTVKGGPSGTGNLLNIQNNAGTTLSYFNSAGNLTVNPGTITSGDGTGNGYLFLNGLAGGQIRFQTAGTSIGQIYFNDAATYFDYDDTLNFRSGYGGTTRASLSAAGALTINGLNTAGGIVYTNASGTLLTSAAGIANDCLLSGGTGTPTWGSCAGAVGSSILWQQVNGTAQLKNTTLDLLVGGTSSASAKFSVLNINSGVPTASIAGTTTGAATYITGEGTIATTNNRSLLLNPGGGNVGIGTTSASSLLHLRGGSAFADNGIKIENSSGSRIMTTTGDGRVYFGSNNSVSAVVSINDDGAYNAVPLHINSGSNNLQVGGTGLFTSATTLGLGQGSFGNTVQITSSSGNSLFNFVGSNFGIGTTSPTAKLQVTGAASADGNALAIFNQTGTGDIFTASDSGVTRFVITEAGNVGIGTTLPNEKFVVSGNIQLLGNGNQIRNSAGNTILNDTSNVISIGNGATTYVNVPTGNVGIGTTTPTSKLHVVGPAMGTGANVNVSGDVQIGTSATSGGTAFFGQTYSYSTGDYIRQNAVGSITINGGGTTARANQFVVNNGKVGISTPTPGFLLSFGTTLHTAGEKFALYESSGASLYGFGVTTGSLDVYTNGTQKMAILSGGNVGIGTTAPGSLLSVGATSQFQVNSSGQITAPTDETINGIDINAGAISDVTNLTASGTITFSGLNTAGGIVYTNGSGVLGSVAGNTGECLVSNGSSAPSWANCLAGDINYWRLSNGALSPVNDTTDLLIGSNASASAKFAFLNVNSGTPTASIAGTTTGAATYITGEGTIATTNNRSLALNPIGGRVGIGTSSPATALEVAGESGGTVRLFNDSVNGRMINITRSSGTTTLQGFRTDLVLDVWQNSADRTVSVTNSGGYLANMTVSGRIGIGTTNPLSPLHVYGTLGGNAAAIIDQRTGGDIFTASASGTNRFVITNAGSVGIGTASPVEDIHLFTTGRSSVLVDTSGNSDTDLRFRKVGVAEWILGRDDTDGAFRINPAAALGGSTGLSILTSGNVGVGTATPASLFSVGSTSQFQVNSSGAIAAATGITSSGTITFSGLNTAGGVVYTDGSGVLGSVAGNLGECLVSNGSSAPSWANCLAGDINYWRLSNGALSPVNDTTDLLIGSNATSSAKFAFLNVNSGTPTASIAGTTTGAATYITGEGTIATTNNRSLAINPNGGNVGVGTTTPAQKLVVQSTDATTLLQVRNNNALGTSAGIKLTTSNSDISWSIVTDRNARNLTINHDESQGRSLIFGTLGSGSESMRITGNGNVGIGTTTPVGKLQLTGVPGAGGNALAIFNSTNSTSDIFTASGSGTSRFVITHAGNVGIGTTIPGHALSVATGKVGFGTSVNNGLLTLRSASTATGTPFEADPVIRINRLVDDGGASSNSTGAIEFGNASVRIYRSDNHLQLQAYNAFNFYNTNYGVTRATLTDLGNFGIGTTTPASKLDIQGGYAGNAAVTINQTNTGDIFTASDSGTTRFVITEAGNVGIGTTNPGYKLDVQGGDAQIGAGNTVTNLYIAGGRAYAGYDGLTAKFGSTLDKDVTFIANNIEYARIKNSNGYFGIATTNPTSLFSVGATSQFQVNTSGAIAAATGITSSGTITFSGLNTAGGIVYTDGSGVLGSVAGLTGECLISNGASAPAWGSCSSGAGMSKWNITAGALTPINTTTDLLVGGTSTASAKFAFLNVNSGVPTASIAGTTTGAATYITGEGTIATTQNRSLLLNPTGGNVGIGTTNPQGRLQIAGDEVRIGNSGTPVYATGDGDLYLSDVLEVTGALRAEGDIYADDNIYGPWQVGTPGTNSIGFYNNSTEFASWYLENSWSNLISSYNNGLRLGTDDTGDIQFVARNADIMRITDTGNVGIGTTAPIAKLELTGAAAAGGNALAIFNQTGTGDIFTASDSGTTRFVITEAGNVGIGTTLPSNKLHISNGSSGATIDSTNYNELTLEDDSHSGLAIYNPNASLGRIVFGTPADSFGASVYWDNTNNLMKVSPAKSGAELSLGYGDEADGIRITSTGTVGIGTTTVSAKLHSLATTEQLRLGYDASNYAAFTVNSSGDITIAPTGADTFITGAIDISGGINAGSGNAFQLNSSGAITAATGITSSGTITFSGLNVAGGVVYTNGSGVLASVAGSSGQCLLSNGASAPSWGGCQAGDINYWRFTNGAFSPVNDTGDLLIGSSATASAKFAFLNVNSGVPTASIAGTTTGAATYVTGEGTIATTQNRSLLLNPTGGNVGIGTTSALAKLDVHSTAVNSDVQRWMATDGSRLGRFTETSGGAGWFEVDNATGTAQWLLRGDGGNSYVASGNFGVGTTTPTAQLDVAGSASLSGTLAFRGTTDPKIDILNGEAFGIRTSGGGDAGLTERFTILSSGLVGIGTTAPTYQLQLRKAGGGDLSLANNAGNGALINGNDAGSGGYLVFSTISTLTATERVRIDSTGNVGIGTTTPIAKLQLTGAPGAGGNALAIFNQTGTGDIFTASDSGTTRFTISEAGDITATGAITANTAETINGVDISAGTVSDVVNLTINSGGDLTIGSIGLNDVGSSNVTSGASLVGTYDEFDNSNSTTVQDVLDDLDAVLSSVAAGGSFDLAGDTGTPETIAANDTMTIAGGTNGIDTVVSATDTITLNLDTTEIGTTTFGSGSGFTWTFDAGATDPTIAFASNALTFTAATNTFAGNVAIGNNTLSGGTAAIDFTNFDVTSGGNTTIGGTLDVTGISTFTGNINANGGFDVDDAFVIADGGVLTTSQTANFNGAVLANAALTIGDNIADTVTVNSGAWTFANDTNFTLSGGVNGLSFDTDTLSIDAANNRIGIGTTAPLTELDIAGSASMSGTITFRGSTDPKINVLNGENFGIRTSRGGNTGLSERFTVLSNGNVGIGTATPQEQLHIDGGTTRFTHTSGSNLFELGDTAAAFDWAFSQSSDDLRIEDNNGAITPFTIQTLTGNIGIGTTNPGALLSVGSTNQFQVNSSGIIAKIDNVAHTIDDVSGNLTLSSNSTDVSIADNLDVSGTLTSGTANAFTVDASGNLVTSGTLTANVAETINGVDISAGTISDVVNLTINSGGDLTIGSIGLNDVGSSNITSGASLVGTYDEFDNSNSTTVQDVLDDFDATLTSLAGGNTFTLAGDTGTPQTISGTDTMSIVGGTNGIDTVASATDTLTLNLDTTEIGTTTFGSGSGFTWTFDAGATDPTIAFASNALTFTAGTNTFAGNVAIGNNTLSGGSAVIDFTNFDVASTGNTTINAQLGVGAAPSSDYLTHLDAHSTGDFSRALNITQNNNADEDDYGVYITNNASHTTANRLSTGLYIENNVTNTGGGGAIFGIDQSLQPTMTVNNASGTIVGNRASVGLSNVSVTGAGTSSSSFTGGSNSLSGTPVINQTSGSSSALTYIGTEGNISITPTLTSLSTGVVMNATGGYFSNSVTSAGHANLTANIYGVQGTAFGDLTTTGTTAHYGGYFATSGTADTNYGLFIQSAGATNNYAVYSSQGTNYLADDLFIGGLSETNSNAGFTMNGDDLFVAGMAGIEGNVYTDGSFIAGASTTYSNGSISQSSGETLTMQTTAAALTLQTNTSGNIIVNSAGSIELQDNTNITGDLDVSGTFAAGSANAFTIDISGNVVTTGTVTASTNETINGIDINAGAITDVTNLTTSGTMTFSGLNVAGGIVYTNGSGVLASVAGSAGQCLSSNGSSAPSWGACDAGAGPSKWNITSGALTPVNTTLDLLIGGTATSSADFAFTNVNSGTPTMIVRSDTAGRSLTMTGEGSISTALGRPLLLNSSGGNIGIGTASPIAKFEVSGAPGASGNALAILNNTTSSDIIAASASGTTRFRVDTNGQLYGASFLDQQNSAFYVDPAGTTSVNVAGSIVGGGSTFTVDGTGQIAEIDNVAHLITDTSGNLEIDSNGTKTIITDDLQVTGNDILDSGATSRVTLGATTTLTNTTLTLSGSSTVTASSLATFTTAASLSMGSTTTLTLGGNATVNGGSAADQDLTLQGTSNATRTTSYVLLQPTAGNVGIGTTAPTQNLDIAGDLRIRGNDITDSADTTRITLGATTTLTNTTLTLSGSSTVTASSLATFTTAASLSMGSTTTLTLGGNATINGGSAADQDITIQGTSNATRTSSYVILQPTAGNVGIGTTTPAARLTVNGTVTSSGGAISLNDSSNFDVNIGNGTSTGSIIIANGASTQTVTIGAGGGAKSVTLGSQTSTSGTFIYSGSNGINLNTSINQPVNLGTGNSTGTITLGGTGTQTISIGNGAGIKTVNLGSSTSSSTTNILSGSGGIALGGGSAITVNSSSWDISSAGAATGFTSIATNALTVKPVSGTGTITLQDGTPTSTSTISLSSTLMTIANNALPMVLNANTNGGNTAQLYLASDGRIAMGTTNPSSARLNIDNTTTGNTTETMQRWGFSGSTWGLNLNQHHASGSHVEWNVTDVAGNVYLEFDRGNMYVGQPSTTTTLYGTVVGANTAVIDATEQYMCYDNTTNTFERQGGGCAVSSARYKQNIVPTNYGLDALMDLRAVNFNYKPEYTENPDEVIVGFIAEEVFEVIPEGVVYNDEGLINGIYSDRLLPVAVRAIQELNNKVDSKFAALPNSQTWTLSELGTLNLTEQTNNTYAVATPQGSAVTQLSAFASSVIGNLRAGLINAQKVVTTSLVALQRVETPELATNLISPVGDNDLTIGLQGAQSNDPATKLKVTDENSNTVASIDGDGNMTLAGQLLAQEVTTASLSAETVVTEEIDATSARIAMLEANMAELENIRANTAEIVNATVSGTLYADQIFAFQDKVANALKQPTLLEQLMGDIPQASSSTSLAALSQIVDVSPEFASGSASLNKTLADLNLGQDDVVLGSSALFVNEYFELNGSGYIAQSLGIGESLLIGNGTTIQDGRFEYISSIDPASTLLQIQSHGQGSINFLAGVMTLDDSGLVTISGDLHVAGSVKTETLLTNLITSSDFTNPFQVQVAGASTESAEVVESRFEIINELGTPVATISAQGRAEFAGGIGVGAEDISNANGEVTTDKTSGKAAIAANTSEIKIHTNQVKPESLIYVTPLSSTGNKVLYVKQQIADNPITPENESAFIVGFDTTTDQAVQFNWWIVN